MSLEAKSEQSGLLTFLYNLGQPRNSANVLLNDTDYVALAPLSGRDLKDTFPLFTGLVFATFLLQSLYTDISSSGHSSTASSAPSGLQDARYIDCCTSTVYWQKWRD